MQRRYFEPERVFVVATGAQASTLSVSMSVEDRYLCAVADAIMKDGENAAVRQYGMRLVAHAAVFLRRLGVDWKK